MELKARRELFAREYLKDLNGTQSAIRAGYSKDSARTFASQLLAEEEVQDRIAELAKGRNDELKIEAKDILLELLRIAHMDPAAAVDEDGCVQSLLDIPIDLRRTISSFEVENMQPLGIRTKVKFWNKNDALNSLGRHLALFKDVIEHRFDGGIVASDAEAAAKTAAILEDARRRAVEYSALV